MVRSVATCFHVPLLSVRPEALAGICTVEMDLNVSQRLPLMGREQCPRTIILERPVIWRI